MGNNEVKIMTMELNWCVCEKWIIANEVKKQRGQGAGWAAPGGSAVTVSNDRNDRKDIERQVNGGWVWQGQQGGLAGAKDCTDLQGGVCVCVCVEHLNG